MTSTKKQKMKISRSIVEAVRSLEPQGRFLEKDQSSGKWFDIGDKKAVEKTSQALRDGAAGLRKQLSEDLCDPDFLSAVFDMDVVPTEKKTVPPLKKEKKLPAKKGHRRTKSNPTPTMGLSRAKHHVKKTARLGEVPVSPRPQRHQSLHLPLSMKPPPPQSPITSPRSSSGSPHTGPHYHSIPGAAHRRVHSQSSVPIKIPSLPNSPVNLGTPFARPGPLVNSNSYDYHDPMDHGRRPPPRFGSQSPHHYPSPMSPNGQPPSPYHMKPRSPYHPPSSPRWSPRTGYARPAHSSLSPHPYMHPTDFYRRPSPDRRPLPLSPRDHPLSSPREHYPRTRCYPSYKTTESSNLTVPALGGEQISRHGHPPLSPRVFPSPRNRESPHLRNSPVHSSTGPRLVSNPCDEPSIPKEFKPPPTSLRLDSSSFENNHEASVPMEEDHVDEKKDEEGDTLKIVNGKHKDKSSGSPFAEKTNSMSPSAVADVATSSKPVKEESSHRDSTKDEEDDYPFEEKQNPTYIRETVSPLPFDHEDPASLMELPDNILSLPISPCGPNDGEL